MRLAWTPSLLLVRLWCSLALRADGEENREKEQEEKALWDFTPTGRRAEEESVTPTWSSGPGEGSGAEPGLQQQVARAPGSMFLLKLRVVDALSGRPLSGASVHVFLNLSLSSSAQTREDGEAWFSVPHKDRAVISALASKRGYVPALQPVAAGNVPVFSSVTLPLLGVNRGNMWMFNDSVLVTRKSTGVSGAQSVVQFQRSALTLSQDGALSAAAAFMNSPSLSPAEGAPGHTVGILSTNSGPVPVDLTPVASVFVQLVSSSSATGAVELNVTGPVSLSLSVCGTCGLQDGDHVPAWSLDQSAGAWVRRGLGTVRSMDGTLLWTFTAPHLGHWMAAPLSPSRGVTLELHVDFLLRHGSFLMILLGSTLTVAVCLLVGLLCCPRSHKETKSRRPAVKPLLSVKDQSTSTGQDLLVLNPDAVDQYHLAIFNPAALADPDLQQTRDHAAGLASDRDEEKVLNQPQKFGNGLFFYNQPLAILHAPGFFTLDERTEQHWELTQEDVSQTKIINTGGDKDRSKKLDVKSRAHSCLSESVSDPRTIGQTVVSLQKGSAPGPRAWFVSLEGKPAAEIRYAVPEEQRPGSRDTSLDSGLDLTEPGQARRDERKLERNATFVKKSNKEQDGAGQ